MGFKVILSPQTLYLSFPFSIYYLCWDAGNNKKNENTKGITINNREYKLSQYADDTVFMLDGKDKSLNETLNLLFEYLRFSGLI